MLRRAMGSVSFPRKKSYEGVRFNVISFTKGWVEVKFPGKKHYVTLEWPPRVNIRSEYSPQIPSNLDDISLSLRLNPHFMKTCNTAYDKQLYFTNFRIWHCLRFSCAIH